MNFEYTAGFAVTLDEENDLKHLRQEFLFPKHQGHEAIYFLGNSLGLQLNRTTNYVQEVMDQWASHGVEGFFRGNHPWINYHDQLLPTLCQLVGAEKSEVVVMNQLSVNLHLMLASFYEPQGKRNKILCEAKAFPSDQYVLHSHVKQRGFNPEDVIVEVHPSEGEELIREEDIHSTIQKYAEELALVFWGGVNYYTGQVFDMEAISQLAHSVDAKVGFDLAHAAGNIPLHLHEWGVDFACWCSYKYLNSGPGAIGGCYIHERYHKDAFVNRFAGWWGNKKETQFLMQKEFEPELSAQGWQLSTPSPILYAAHKASLDVFAKAGVTNVFQKNRELNDYLWFVLEQTERQVGQDLIRILTPRNEQERGCQVSLSITNGKQVFDELTTSGIYADWREPDVIRIAPVALYNTFVEVWQFGQLLKSAIIKHSS